MANRPFDEVDSILYIDANHNLISDNGVIRELAAYEILGINTEGKMKVHNIGFDCKAFTVEIKNI